MIVDRKFQFTMKLATWLSVFVVIMPCLAVAQTTILNLSQDLVRLGIASSNMVPNQPSLDAGPLLFQAINYAGGHQIGRVIADTGSYYFLSLQQQNIHVSLNQVNNLTIDFQGSDLFLAFQKHGIGIYAGTNTTLQNFTIDYLQQLYTQLRIVAVNPTQRQLQFTVEPGWQNPSALNAFLNLSGPTETDVFVFRNGQPWASYTRMPVQQPFADDKMTLAPDFFATSSIIGQIRPGDIAVLTVRVGGIPIGAGPCNGCTFRNIRIYSGLVGFYLDGQSSLVERVYVMPRPGTDRLVSTIADGITLTQPGPNNTVRLSRAIRTLDDGISPHVWVFGSVQSLLSSRSLQVQGDFATALNQNRPLPNGSNVAFQRPSDGAMLGNAVVVSQTPAPPQGGLPQIILNFDRDLPNNLLGSYIYSTDANQRGGNTLLERNTVQEQGYARGISLWGLMNSTLRGNYIRRPAMTGVFGTHRLITGDWLVPPLVNLTLSNNVIDGANTVLDGDSLEEMAGIEILAQQSSGLPMAGSPHQNINLSGNFIADPARSAIWVGNTTGGSINGNYFFNPNNNPVLSRAFPPYSSQLLQPLVVNTSQSVSIGVNTVDQTSGRAFVTDSQYRVLAAYAPGSIIRLNAFNLGNLSNPTATLTDADGNGLPIKILNTSTHALDVQLPAAAGLGGAVVTVIAGDAKYLGTLFLDSVDNIPALNGCTYSISPASNSAPAGSSTLSFLVITQAGCSYQMLASDSFINPGGPGIGTGLLSVGFATNTGAARTTTIEIAGHPITLRQEGTAPGPPIAGVVNGASFAAGAPVAPGSILSIFGSNLATSAAATGSTPLPTGLLTTSVTINSRPIPLYYVSPTQINAQVPFETPTGTATLAVTVNGALSPAVTFPVAATAPGIFQYGANRAVAQNPDGSINASDNPARPGDIIVLYMTGQGAVSNPIPTGAPALGSPLSMALATTTATIGGANAEVLFSGLTPGLVGLLQVNIRIPNVAAGDQPLVVTIGGVATQSALITVASP